MKWFMNKDTFKLNSFFWSYFFKSIQQVNTKYITNEIATLFH